MPYPSRYIPNTYCPLLTLPPTTDNYLSNLTTHLTNIITKFPPLESYSPSTLSGLWSGPTALSYLLFKASRLYPHLHLKGHHLITWSKAYLVGRRETPHHPLRLHHGHCGIASEKLAYEAVKAVVEGDIEGVRRWVGDGYGHGHHGGHAEGSSHGGNGHSSENVLGPVIAARDGEDERFPDELLYGRAGTLYLMRMMRHYVPGAGKVLERMIGRVSEVIVQHGATSREGGGWVWHGKRYLGAVHGDVGILVQLLLTTPGLAPRLRGRVRGLLREVGEDGGFGASVGSGGYVETVPEGKEGEGQRGKKKKHLVQFCHGPAGLVVGLEAIRGVLVEAGVVGEEELGEVVKRGRECVWREGLLRKEPSLCHGVWGNGIALPPGPQREHFFAFASPGNVDDMRQNDPTMFETADYGAGNALLASYDTSAAWAWMVGMGTGKIIGFNDV